VISAKVAGTDRDAVWVISSDRPCKWESTGAEGRWYGNQFWDAICHNWLFLLSVGYNFDCMIASDTLFDSRGGFLESSDECLRVVSMATDFGTKIAITGLCVNNSN